MRNKRKYRRFKLNDLEVQSTMLLVTEVKVLDISITGISLKANRWLHIGSDYTLKLVGSKTIPLRGTVIWCSLVETRKGPRKEIVPIYSAGMQFKNMSRERIRELLYFIEGHKIKEAHVTGGARLNIRFHIKDPENTVLFYPDNFRVKTISLGGMLIECPRNFEIEDRIPMELFIHDDNRLNFVGRVGSSQVIEKEGQKHYDIGIEFLDLTEKDREVLASCIDHSAMTHTETGNEQKTTAGTTADENISSISRKFIDKVEYLYEWHKTMGYYNMLGITEYANDEQVRHAFLRKVHELHPDKFPKASDDLKQKLNVLLAYLTAARSTLLDPQKRKEYDRMRFTRGKGWWDLDVFSHS